MAVEGLHNEDRYPRKKHSGAGGALAALALLGGAVGGAGAWLATNKLQEVQRTPITSQTNVAPEQRVALMNVPALREELETRAAENGLLYPLCAVVDMPPLAAIPQGHMFIPLENGKAVYFGPRNGQTNAEVRARC